MTAARAGGVPPGFDQAEEGRGKSCHACINAATSPGNHSGLAPQVLLVHE
jgi:hypothetical protein